MRSPAPRLTRLLVSATVPMMLITGCSSKSEPDEKKNNDSAPPSASPTLEASVYKKLPKPCDTITEKTVKDLVPGTKDSKGENASSSDVAVRGGCSWNGLDEYQYRWLNVFLQRYDSVAGVGSAKDQAVKRYEAEITEAGEAKDAVSTPVKDVGDETVMITYASVADKEEYQNVTVVTRSENAVSVVSYNGAGLEEAGTPKAADLQKDAQKAAGEAVASLITANK